MTILSENYDAFLQVAGLLIPEGPETPPASEVLKDVKLVDRAIATRPDLEPLVAAAVAKADGTTTMAEVEDAVGFPSAEFNALTLIVAGAYYLSPAVLDTLDYDPPTERYVNAFLEQEIVELLPRVRCTPRFTP